MNRKALTSILILSIILSAFIGAGANYYLNDFLQRSHRTTYSLEEEVDLYDQMIEKANNKEFQPDDLVRIFVSEKKRRVAAHNLMPASQRIFESVVAILFVLGIFQVYLVYLCFKSKNEEKNSL